METSIEGDTHGASDSKSSGSPLRRTELFIDLNLPLPVIMKRSNPSEQLPSLEVPEHKSRWCADYTHKIGVDGSERDKIGSPSLRLRKEIDQASKEGDANLIKHSRCDLREDTTNDLKCRKTQKVRLMTELLSEKFNMGRSSVNAELFSANNMSMKLNTVVAPMDKCMRKVTSQPENELYLKEKLRQTLSSFTSAQKHVNNDTTQRKNIPYWPTTLNENKSYDPLKINGVGSSQSLQKEVIPIVSQPIVAQLDQSRRNSFINLNSIIDLNHRSILQRNHPLKVTERGASTYVPPTGNMKMFRNRHERNYPQTQNGVFPWRNSGSTNFNPIYANDGLLRSGTATTQVKDQTIKLSNSVQVSSLVSTRWGSHNVKISSPVKISIAQNTAFRPYNLHENYKPEKFAPGLVQKGKTISDLKSTNSMRVEDNNTKGIRSLNPFSNEDMSATQLSRYHESPFTPYNIHAPFHMHRNPGIYNGSFLPHYQLKESSGIYMSGFTEVQSSRQHDQGVSLESQEKKRKAHALEKLGKRKLQQSTSSSGLLHTTRNSGPKIDLMQDDNISKTLDMGSYCTPATILPVISIYKKNPSCLFNQNPADIADANDERFFRTIEDQRIRDKSLL